MVEARGATDAKPPLAAMAARIEDLLSQFDALATPRQNRERAEELVRTIVGVYGEGLERVLTIVHESTGELSEDVFRKLCDDAFVESLLCLHGLHPYSLEDRVRAALDAVRPYLESHDGGIEVLGIEGDVAVVQFEGGCSGCPSSRATLELSVQRAILERVPEIRAVRAEGVDAPAAGPASTLRLESDWLRVDDLTGLASDGVAAVTVGGLPVLVAQVGDTLYAYRDTCPACGVPMANGAFEPPWLRCAACANRFDLVHAGRAGDGSALFVEPFPLVRENGRVRIAVPLGV